MSTRQESDPMAKPRKSLGTAPRTGMAGGVRALLLGYLLLATAVQGFSPPGGAALGDLDKRLEAVPGPSPRTAVQGLAVQHLKARLPTAGVADDRVPGGPALVWAADGFLSGPDGAGRALSLAAGKSLAKDDHHRAAKVFLNEHAALFGHDASALAATRLRRDYVTPHNGLRTAVWQQELDGIAVFDGLLVAHTTRRGELVSLASHFLPSPATAADAGTPARGARQQAPTRSARQALAAAAQSLGMALTEGKVAVAAATTKGAEQNQRLRAPGLLGEATAKLVWLPMNRETMRLCWEVLLTSQARGEMFQVVVDAETAAVVVRRCLTYYGSVASYRVFDSDSPSPFSPSLATPSSYQPPLLPRQLLTLAALSATASPNDWINDGDNTTLGNNVDAHLDRDGDNVPDPGSRPTGAPFRVFDAPLDLSQAPTTYSQAAVIQLFYLTNYMHDRLYDLGFTEAAGNFQADNLGRGGLGNDALQAEAQDGSDTNNATISVPPDGAAPRLEMFIFTGPTPARDGSLDAEVVFHEYVHGLSNRLVGGGGGIGMLQPGGLAEGWSDFYALALLSAADDDLNANYTIGSYVAYQPGGFTENYYFGIRRYPYSIDMSRNPLTFKDIDPTQASSHAGIPCSPLFGGSADEVHNMGEVWCVILWEARASLIRKHGWATGNQLILQLVTDGMRLSPANPSYVQARDAILQADLVLSGGANLHELWAAFAKRGLGASASAPASSSTTGLVESYDLPDDLWVIPSAPQVCDGPVGGPFSPSSAVYDLTNLGTAALDWTATRTQAWTTLSASAGTLAPGASTTVTCALNDGAAALPYGAHSDTVSFRNASTGVTQKRGLTLAIAVPLAEAINQPSLRVTSPGNLPWIGQTTTTHDGLHAARSGQVPDNQRTTLETTLAGPGTLCFWWKVSSEYDYDLLTFAIDGIDCGPGISGEVDWQRQGWTLAPGEHTLSWTYSKDESAGSGSDAAWVDQVSLRPPGTTVARFALDTDPGWTADGEWAFGVPLGQGGLYGFPDPTSGATGANVYGVNLAGDYAITPGGPWYLTAGPFDFSSWSDVTLRFQRWLNSDYSTDVSATLEASNDGSTWALIWQAEGPGIRDSAWTEYAYDLSAVADGQPTVYVRWGYAVMRSANVWAHSGWNLDDIAFEAATTSRDFYVAANGDDAQFGTTPATPMRHAQALLDRYPRIGAGCTVHLGPGVYTENVQVGGQHGGLTLAGAGDGPDPATATHLVGQGGALNADVVLVTASGVDAANPTTIRGLRVSSAGGLGGDVAPAAPTYGGITLDATPSAWLHDVSLREVTATAVTGTGTGCGILITGSSALTNLVSGVTLDGVVASGNGSAGILLQDTQTAGLSLGGSRPGALWQNGGDGLLLEAEPDLPGQFAPFAISNTSFYDNHGYDIKLRYADSDIDARTDCVFVGAATLAEVEQRLWHQSDDPALGRITFGLPRLGGNRLSWNPATQRLTLNGRNLSAGESWYDLGVPSGAQARLQVVPRTGSLCALVKAVDLTGGDHADAVPMADGNELYFRWTLRNGSVTVLSETSVVGASTAFAAYDSKRNTTLVGRAARPGIWLYGHLILGPEDLVRDYQRP